MPPLPSALPPKGEARRYVANDFLNLIAFPSGEGCDTRIPSSKKGGEAATKALNLEPNKSKVKRGCEEMRIHFFTAPSRYTYFLSTDKRMSIWIGFAT